MNLITQQPNNLITNNLITNHEERRLFLSGNYHQTIWL